MESRVHRNASAAQVQTRAVGLGPTHLGGVVRLLLALGRWFGRTLARVNESRVLLHGDRSLGIIRVSANPVEMKVIHGAIAIVAHKIAKLSINLVEEHARSQIDRPGVEHTRNGRFEVNPVDGLPERRDKLVITTWSMLEPSTKYPQKCC